MNRQPRNVDRNNSPVLETERLSLRQLTVNDAPFILALLNEPSFIRNIGDRGVKTEEEASGYILNGPVASYQRHGFGLYLVELKQNQTPIGICGLLKRDNLDYADLGFAFRPPFWSQGYAGESARAMLSHGRTNLKMRQIAAIVNPDNHRSIKLLEKLGFRFHGDVRMSEVEAPISLFLSEVDTGND
jgi:ribosomal-protein-alanine N-acetyltransferase